MNQQLLKYCLLLFLSSFLLEVFSQDIPIGSWRDHLRYSDGVSVTYGDKVVYCASSSAIFSYNTEDYSIERMNKINGLSDIGIAKVIYINSNQKLLIAYTNGNLDLIDKDKNITNIPFIKNSNIIADKTINEIHVSGSLAYLSTGFGIVVLNCTNNEILDTYLIGVGSSYIQVNSIAFDADNIYAATVEGVYSADKNSGNLADYNEWNKVVDLGTENYSQLAYFSGKLFISSESPTWSADTVYVRESTGWEKFLPNGLNINKLSVYEDNLLIVEGSGVSFYDLSFSFLKRIYTHKSQFTLAPGEVYYKGNDLWIADNNKGLIRQTDNWNGEIIVSNGPQSKNSFYLDFSEGKLCQTSGGYGVSIYDYPFNVWENNNWSESVPQTIYNIKGDRARDFVCVAINPSNNNQVYYGAWDHGLFEYSGNTKVNQFTAQDSPLDSTYFGTTRVSALEFDENNNLWAMSSYSNSPLSVKSPSGEWYNFSFPGMLTTASYYSRMVVDKNGWKWVIDPLKNGVLIFDENGTLANDADDRAVYMNSANTNISGVFDANIPGDRVYSIAEDLDGEIWLGTNEGVVVINSTIDVFNQTVTATPIYIQQDGQTQLLLESETVTVIAVDGANRKWFGTQNSGVFLMSEDGTEEIEHFTTSNSPLFSDNVYDISINGVTGEVFIATEKGLISYKGTATESNEDFNNVFVYPNPVRPNYDGVIAIRGLTLDTDVRITDVSGNMVFQTKSLGGQAIWNGKDLNGNRVQTGVYMVFSATEDGELKNAAKILFIH